MVGFDAASFQRIAKLNIVARSERHRLAMYLPVRLPSC
jgi:hypothetical protein